MKYWLLKGICTPAHKAHARQKGVRIIDAKFADRFDEKSIYKPSKDVLKEISATNKGLGVAEKVEKKEVEKK